MLILHKINLFKALLLITWISDDEVFPRERILNITSINYCESVGRKVSDYEFRGAQVSVGFEDKRNGDLIKKKSPQLCCGWEIH